MPPNLPPVHNIRQTKKISAVERANRNQAKRQYKTNSATWRRLRATVLITEPLCRECAKQGKITEATEVDHIDDDTFNNLTSNLQPLCKPCHSRKTEKEHGFE